MMRASSFFTLSILLVALATPCRAGMQKDLRTCNAGESAESISACTRVLKSGRLPRKQFYIAHFNRGWAYRNAGKLDEALQDFDRSQKLNPKHADTYYSRAVVRTDREEFKKAEADLDLYLKLKGHKQITHYNRALLFRRLGKPGIALDEVEKARALAPSNKKLAVLRTLILSDLDDHETSQSEIDALILAAPDHASSYYARAVIAFRQQNFDRAKSDVEKAISLQKGYSAAHLLLGRLLEERGDHAIAKAHFEKAISLPAPSVEALYTREEARSALAGLKEDKPTRRVAASTGPTNCRRFLPATGITIAVACP